MNFRVVVYLLNLWFLVLAISVSEAAEDSSTWPSKYPDCGGESQSPVELNISLSLLLPLESVTLGDYEIPIETTIVNDGHIINVDILRKSRQRTPFLFAFNNTYEAVSFQFHWGSPGVLGSEHKIDGQKEDIELHIIHMNPRYATAEEALQHEMGTVHLAILIKKGTEEASSPGLMELCNKLPSLAEYNSTGTLSKDFTLQSILENSNLTNGEIEEYFYYHGSLTRPPCTENVTWVISTVILTVPEDCLQKFWSLKNANNEPLVNNFRPLQPLNDRIVFIRTEQGNYADL